MTPSLADVAERVAVLVRDEAVPALVAQGADYAAGQVMRGALLLQAASQAFEHGAAWRVAEVRALQALFVQAAGAVDDAALAASLRHAASLPADDLRLSALDAMLATLHAPLIALQAWTETTPHPAAALLNAAVWQLLRDGTERRRLPIGHF